MCMSGVLNVNQITKSNISTTKSSEKVNMKKKSSRLKTFLLSLCAVLIALIYYQLNKDIHPDFSNDTPNFIEKYGYPSETHYVTSEDGFVSVIHRIPHGRDRSNRTGRPVAFLQHGIMCSSDSWVYRGPEQDLAFILADAGYDVWLGNARGNYYSRNHSNMTKSYRELWSFSVHEAGYYDLPAVIDYILLMTNKKDIFYVGHSMGSALFFIMCSEKPEYNKKVRAMVALTPVAAFDLPQTPLLSILIPGLISLQNLLSPISLNKLMVRGSVRDHFLEFLCDERSISNNVCQYVYDQIGGFSLEPRNKTFYSIFFSHIPSALDVNFMKHYTQTSYSGKFHQYDFGEEENLKRYNNSLPPEYNLSNVKVPVAIYYAEKDLLATKRVVDYIRDRLPNVVEDRTYKNFNHFDVMWGENAAKDIFKPIKDWFMKYSHNFTMS